MLGLCGNLPEGVDPATIPAILEEIRESGSLPLRGGAPIPFAESQDIVFRMGEFLPGHANAMRFIATYPGGRTVSQVYFSIGGGAIVAGGGDALYERAEVALANSGGTCGGFVVVANPFVTDTVTKPLVKAGSELLPR